MEEREGDPKMKPLTGTISHGNAQMGQVFKHFRVHRAMLKLGQVFKHYNAFGAAQITTD